MKKCQSFILSVLILSSTAFPLFAYYHPDEGRWLSRDPIADESHKILLHITDDIILCDSATEGLSKYSQNVYLTLDNDMLNFVDYLGLYKTEDSGKYKCSKDQKNTIKSGMKTLQDLLKKMDTGDALDKLMECLSDCTIPKEVRNALKDRTSVRKTLSDLRKAAGKGNTIAGLNEVRCDDGTRTDKMGNKACKKGTWAYVDPSSPDNMWLCPAAFEEGAGGGMHNLFLHEMMHAMFDWPGGRDNIPSEKALVIFQKCFDKNASGYGL